MGSRTVTAVGGAPSDQDLCSFPNSDVMALVFHGRNSVPLVEQLTFTSFAETPLDQPILATRDRQNVFGYMSFDYFILIHP